MSPILTGTANLNVYHSKFEKFSSNVVFSSPLSFFASRSTFKDTLDRAVVLSDKFSKQVFEKRQETSDSNYEIDGCLFINCVSKDNDGGAIYAFTTSSGGNVQIKNTGFRNCVAKRGGAVFVVKHNLEITSCCFEKTSANLYAAIYLTNSDSSKIESSSFTSISSTECEGLAYITEGKLDFIGNNISDVKLDREPQSGVIHVNLDTPVIKYTVFSETDSRSVLYLIIKNSPQIENILISSSKAESLVYSTHDISISASYFVISPTKNYVSSLSQGAVIFQNSKFSQSESDVKSKLGRDNHKLENCEFNYKLSGSPVQLTHPEGCWVLITPVPTEEPKGTPSMIVVMLILVPVILVSAFVLLKVLRRFGREDTMPLMYTVP